MITFGFYINKLPSRLKKETKEIMLANRKGNSGRDRLRKTETIVNTLIEV